MKILHILNELRFSGAELLLASAADILMRDGNQHVILATGEKPGVFAKTLADRGYAIEHRPFSKSPAFLLGVRRRVKEEAIDLVHVHTERANFWYGLAARSAGAQCVRTVHNDFGFDGSLRLRRGFQRRLLERISVRHVACSDRVARNEARRFGIHPETIHNWFDPARIPLATPERRAAARRELGLDPSSFAIVSVGNHGPAKNQEAIVDAVGLSAVSSRLEYFHCGDAGADLVERVAPEHRGRVHFEGPVPDIAKYLVAADAFVSASFFEGGQLSLLEAAASATPCATTNVGLAEVFSDQPGVLFVEPTAASLAAAIDDLAAMAPEARAAMGQGLARFARERFTPEVGAGKYLDLYGRLMRGEP